jgi:NAD(P)-dependent dehydrogenase (short-subunit alcohol dehydrogenase family)
MTEGMSAQLNFNGRVALVTGGASGIGRAVAAQLIGLGAKVAIADRNIKGANGVAQELGVKNAIALEVDVANPESVNAMADAVTDRFGRLDILVHSAGVGIERSFLKTTPEEWQRLIDIDLSGTFYCAQAAARLRAHCDTVVHCGTAWRHWTGSLRRSKGWRGGVDQGDGS